MYGVAVGGSYSIGEDPRHSGSQPASQAGNQAGVAVKQAGSRPAALTFSGPEMGKLKWVS